MSRIDTSKEFIPVRIAVMTVSDTRTVEDDRSGETLVGRIEAAGHVLADRTIVKDEREVIAAKLRDWCANPEIDVIVPIYDSMSQFVVPALRLTGNLGSVKVATFNGTPFVLDYIQEGSVSMDIGESLDWIAYATVDANMRDLCGLPVPEKLNVPFYIFDESNAEMAGTPAQFDTGYGDAYVSGFRELWGLN